MNQTVNTLPIQSIGGVCRRYHVKELSLFGSAARDELRAESDIDFLVEFEEDAIVGFLALARLQAELSALVKRSVDLVPKGGLKPSIRFSVLQEAKVLYAS
jgi:uncharacterized protein